MYSNIKVFCDFDGTITNQDLGDEIFKLYGQFDPFHSQLVAGEINILEYWNRIVPTLPINIEPEIINLALNSELDPYFANFVNMCNSEGISLYIVSDGFSSYIEPILRKFNIDNKNIYCNKIDFSGAKPEAIFYGATESCDCMSASCKKNVILNNTRDSDISIFIGDGYSDYCGAEHSDVIFAKKNLARYCSENKLPFFNYKSFFDILRVFENHKTGKLRFRKRRQAELKAKSAFEQE